MNTKTETPIKVPDRITPVFGFRVWSFDSTQTLHSPYAAEFSRSFQLSYSAWIPFQSKTAMCLMFKKHTAPDVACHCGIYAFKSFWRCIEYWKGGGKTPNLVFGKVALWGKVIIHTQGYLGEFAYPQELYVPKWADDTQSLEIELLGMNYGIPVVHKT